ncbi:MAG TPA: ribosomal protein L7/L12 [Abditibacteriaceae bacterium]|jgi:nitrogen fixation protein FixH
MFGLGTTEWVIIAFLFFDTLLAVGVVLFVNAKKKNSGNSGNTFSADSNESPFHSSTHSVTNSVNAVPLNNEEIVSLLRQGRKIEAVKIYRERTNLGLKEAKDAVEALERQI